VIWVDEDPDTGTTVRGMQWPSYHDAVMDKFRTDPRLLMILEPLIGCDIKQIINQVHWKRPGSNTSWPLHRDVRSRRPGNAFIDLYTSWVQTGIAVDPHLKENGAMQIVPGSHRDAEHDPEDKSLWQAPQYADDPRIKDMVLEPGDVEEAMRAAQSRSAVVRICSLVIPWRNFKTWNVCRFRNDGDTQHPD